VYITGESPLVEEYAALGSAHGYDVVVQWNEDRKRDKEYRRSAIVPAGTSIALELTNTDLERKKRNLQKLDKALPPTAAIISSSVTVSASEQATWIINEACFALQEGVSTPAELDTAMKLGVNYPRGPIEWAEAIGIRQVEAVLRALERDLGEDRYRVAPLLHQMALTGEWWNRNPREGS